MSQKNRFVIALLCYSIMAIVGCAKREIRNIGSEGTNIICFGDSLTFGYGVSSNQAYPVVLSKMLNNIPVVNAGIDGDTSIEGLKRLKSDVLNRNPLLVILEFGGNDFLRKITFEVTIKNIEEMIKNIQSHGSMVAIADIGLGGDLVMGRYSQEYKRLSKRYNTIFIPRLVRGILSNPSLKSDFIHPNAEGYKAIAQKVYQSILPYLKQNNLLRKYKE